MRRLSAEHREPSSPPPDSHWKRCDARRRLLIALLVTGVITLLLVGFGGTVAFIRYTTRLKTAVTEDVVCRLHVCAFGARCRLHTTTGQPFCRCEHVCREEDGEVGDAVCGSDGKRYTSGCLLEKTACVQQKRIRVESCDLRCAHIQCPEDVDAPVCAEDNRSYASECELRRQSCKTRKTWIRVKHNGLCLQHQCAHHLCPQPHALCHPHPLGPQCQCPLCQPSLARVCASDHRVYDSECHLKREACLSGRRDLRVLHAGLCGDKCRQTGCRFGAQCLDGECRCVSCKSDVKSVVCGTDGNSYDNECLLRNHSCHLAVDIRVKHNGSCVAPPPETSLCPQCPQNAFEPVCANDGITYSHECQLRRNACLLGRDLTALFYGQCDGDDDRDDGSAHEMALHFTQNCAKDCLFGAQCVVTAEGESRCECQFRCSAVVAVVCGQTEDNEMRYYDNECRLREDSCLRQKRVRLCEECRCNRFGSQEPLVCHQKQCKCRRGVGGERCDRCEPAFFAFGQNGCVDCNCDAFGSVRSDCEQTTGRCVCKVGVSGVKCNECEPNSVLGVDGCVHRALALPESGSCAHRRCDFGATCRQTSANETLCVCAEKCDDGEEAPRVCASDGTTHASECLLRRHSCRLQRKVARQQCLRRTQDNH